MTTIPWVGTAHPVWQGYAKMSEAEVKALQGLITEHDNVHEVLEIGALNGFSTVNMALALAHRGGTGRITTVDIFQKDAERDDEANFDRNVQAFGIGARVAKVRGYSSDPEVLSALGARRFDLIFHDAEHRYWPVMRDILNYEDRLAVGGFFVLHDYVDQWTLREAVDDFFGGNPAYRFVRRVDSLIAYQKIGATAGAWRRRLRFGPKYLIRGLAFRSRVCRAALGLWGGREAWL
jgi:predicted O-methyltransferase YrrM